MTARICPRCGRNDVRQSDRRSVGDKIMACFGLTPYRCRACRNRFFRFPLGNGNSNSNRNGNSITKRVQPVAEISEPIVPAVTITVQPVSPVSPLSYIPVAYSLLIVSRDPAIRKLLCKLLTRPGYHTHELADALQIPSELRSRKVDLLIIDLDLPEQQELETVSALRSKYSNFSVIALSGLRIAGTPGAIVLPKPFRRELLLERVQCALVDAAEARVPSLS
jgi:CheY-like chemotaxis protein